MRETQDTSFFWLRRLHSLLGVFPLAAFVIIHFSLNSIAFMGPQAFDRMLVTLHGFPLTLVAEIFFIALPLLLHVLMGLVLIYRSSANVVSYGNYRNWMYLLQRVSGVIALVFISYHVWSMRIAPRFAGTYATYEHTQAHFQTAWVKIFYVVGIVAVVFHLANGLSSALITWGITQGRRSQFAAAIGSWVLMIALWFWGLRILLVFTG